MISELKNIPRYFHTFPDMRSDDCRIFYHFPAKYNRDISLELLVAKRTKLRQNLGLKKTKTI